MAILVPTRGPDDWRALLADPVRHWRQGYSAKAAADRWEGAEGLPPEIAAALPSGAELLFAVPEHKVPLPGRGAASQCDVFALTGGPPGLWTVAVEAKVREPFGPTVAEWLEGASDGKRQRLSAVVGMLGLTPPVVQLRWQLLHRTAAAVIEARRFHATGAAMLVHSFAAEAAWRDDFDTFAAAMGGATPVLPSGPLLRLGWCAGPPV
ncbi:hypothetical protein DXV76_16820 [Rhodobacteraceae bacterium CCMM004]|nr:hypothetical protein DXV76_16820 [Rhodobacteraceae bacterium CCMM004]